MSQANIMSQQSAQDAAIAFLMQDYLKGVPDKISEQLAAEPVKVAKPRKAKLKAPKDDEAPVNPTVKASLPSHIIVGSLDARQYVIAMRGLTDRQQKIETIHAFCGYDIHGDLGPQEMNASLKARRELKPNWHGPASVKHSVDGYIAGMPDAASKARGDLKARERLAVDNIAEHTKKLDELAASVVGGPEDHHLASEANLLEGLIQVEQERLSVIREDLDRVG